MRKILPKIKKPVDAFSKCPSCLMPYFLSVQGIHVFCGFCSWNSMQAYADADGYKSEKQEDDAEFCPSYEELQDYRRQQLAQ